MHPKPLLSAAWQCRAGPKGSNLRVMTASTSASSNAIQGRSTVQFSGLQAHKPALQRRFDLEGRLPACQLTCGPPNPRNAVCEGRLVRHTLPWARSAGKR